ncbi:dimerization domain protein, hAT family [Ancylostoma caninum]|uniref:Dimerization domain protein, hAT family n=1 Tax=Ancylostoma caninum TaxID=29170 RepID=A0A368G591_ANCCA|nr:dimerization domain protein, hAT family [Ancylostoma caninum]
MMIEIQQYSLPLEKQRPDKDSCPFQWWKNHAGEFLLLYKEPPRYLYIPATSVDCERLFSLAGIVFSNKRRRRLSGKHARFLLMCKAHANEDVGRERKSWSASDIKRYSKSDIAVGEIDDS